MNQREYQNMYNHEADHFFYRITHDAVLSLASRFFRSKRTRVLDVGCGTGILVKKMGIYARAEGVDAHPEAIRLGRKRDISIKRGTILNLPYRQNSFDLVTCIDVLCHRSISDDTTALTELARVLKPGGHCIIRVPAFQFLYGNHDRYVHTKHRYTKSELKKLLTQSGMKVEFLSYMNAGLFIPSIVKKLSEMLRSPSASSTVSSIPSWLNFALYALLTPEVMMMTAGIPLPFGIEVLAICKKQNHSKA